MCIYKKFVFIFYSALFNMKRLSGKRAVKSILPSQECIQKCSFVGVPIQSRANSFKSNEAAKMLISFSKTLNANCIKRKYEQGRTSEFIHPDPWQILRVSRSACKVIGEKNSQFYVFFFQHAHTHTHTHTHTYLYIYVQVLLYISGNGKIAVVQDFSDPP